MTANLEPWSADSTCGGNIGLISKAAVSSRPLLETRASEARSVPRVKVLAAPARFPLFLGRAPNARLGDSSSTDGVNPRRYDGTRRHKRGAGQPIVKSTVHGGNSSLEEVEVDSVPHVGRLTYG